MTDLVVCGGGAIGLSVAFEAAKRGNRVVLVESKTIGSGASWAGAGILPPGATLPALDPIDQLRAASHAMFPSWIADLEKISHIDVGFSRCGGLYLARTAGEQATLMANETWWTDQGIAFESLNRSELLRRCPALAVDSIRRAWYLPDECQVRNPRYLKALEKACRLLGVEIRESEELVNIRSQHSPPNSDSCSVVTNRSKIQSARVCVTTGAWTRQVLQEFAAPTNTTDIFPVRGQIVLFRLPQQPCSHVVNDGHRYLVPRQDGLVLAGSCEEEVGFDASTTPAMIDALAAWARGLMPCLSNASIEKTWAGLRPASIDGFPYISPIPGMPSVFVAAGHYRHGIHFSPITAQLVVDAMQGVQSLIALEPFKLGRGQTYAQ